MLAFADHGPRALFFFRSARIDRAQVYIDAIQTLHLSACDELDLGEHTKRDIESLLSDLRSMLEGVGMLRELTARYAINGRRLVVVVVLLLLLSRTIVGIPWEPMAKHA